MTDSRELAHDRAMRDAALALFKRDIEHIRADLAGRGIGQRIADRLGEGAVDMADEAMELAADNRGKVGAGIAALLLYVFRGPLFDWLFGEADGDDDEASEEPERGTRRSH